MITSSISNQVMFKKISTYPSARGTLHCNRKIANKIILPFFQPFDKADVLTLQFSSDSDTVPTFKAYNFETKAEIETITGSLVSTRAGDAGTRHYFNYTITLDADYTDKKAFFVVTQGSDSLTSEPIHVYDLTEDIYNGFCSVVHYTNYDRVESDLDGRFMDWENIGTADNLLYIYQYGAEVSPSDTDEAEILEEAETKDIVSSSSFLGINFKTNPVPTYRARQLRNILLLDYWAINEVQYIRGNVDTEHYGDSTSLVVNVEASQKMAEGFNVDDLGIYETTTENNTNMVLKYTNQVADFDIEIPDGHMLHTVMATHAATSTSNNAVIKLGTTSGGEEFLSARGGAVARDGKTHSYPIHNMPDFDAASRFYVGISGTNVVLDFIIIFDNATPS